MRGERRGKVGPCAREERRGTGPPYLFSVFPATGALISRYSRCSVCSRGVWCGDRPGGGWWVLRVVGGARCVGKREPTLKAGGGGEGFGGGCPKGRPAFLHAARTFWNGRVEARSDELVPAKWIVRSGGSGRRCEVGRDRLRERALVCRVRGTLKLYMCPLPFCKSSRRKTSCCSH